MKQLYLILILITFCLQFGFSQDIQKTLGKAFTSKDSSDYYFKLAKKSIKTEKDEANYFFCKGARHRDYNRLDSAIFYTEKAILVFEKLKDYKSLNTLYNNISQSYRKQGEYDKAIKTAILGLKSAENSKSEFWIYYFTHNLGLIYHDFENFGKGIYYGKKALELAKNSSKKDPKEIAGALNTIAINYDDWNKPNEALYYHKQVFKYIKGNDTLTIGSTYNNIGNTLLKQKKYKEAEKWINIAVAISEINDRNKADRYDIDFYNKATNFTNLAAIAFKTNDFEKAEKLFEKAKVYCLKSNNAEKMRDYYRYEYEFNKARKNLQKTIESQDQYIKLRDSVFNKNRDKSFLEIEAKYQNEKKEKELLKSKVAIANNELALKKKNTQFLILGLISLALLIISYLIYRQQKLKNEQQEQEFKLKSAIARIETQSKLQDQRLQISRDLHDNIGSQLTFIISSVDNIKYAFEIQNSKLDIKLSTISNFARSTIVELRDTIWAMNSGEITLEDLQIRIHNFIDKAKEAKESINFSIDIEENLKDVKFTSIEGMNIYRTIQEAINNSIKYADAKNIKVAIQQDKDFIVISILDNGKGFEQDKIEMGNGINNMKKRITDIGGEIEFKNGKDVGTEIVIKLKNKLT